MEVGNEKLNMEKLVAVEGENHLRRIGAEPFWEVCLRIKRLTKRTWLSFWVASRVASALPSFS